MHTTGQLTNIRRSDDAPELDGVLREVARKKILYYHQLYLIVQTPYLSYRLQLIIQVDYTMILVVYYSCTLTVNLRLCPTKYRRNRVNFASFVRPAMLIL